MRSSKTGESGEAPGPGGAQSCPEILLRGQKKVASQECRLTQEELDSLVLHDLRDLCVLHGTGREHHKVTLAILWVQTDSVSHCQNVKRISYSGNSLCLCVYDQQLKQKSEEQASQHRALGPWMQAVPHLRRQPA